MKVVEVERAMFEVYENMLEKCAPHRLHRPLLR